MGRIKINDGLRDLNATDLGQRRRDPRTMRDCFARIAYPGTPRNSAYSVLLLSPFPSRSYLLSENTLPAVRNAG